MINAPGIEYAAVSLPNVNTDDALKNFRRARAAFKWPFVQTKRFIFNFVATIILTCGGVSNLIRMLTLCLILIYFWANNVSQEAFVCFISISTLLLKILQFWYIIVFYF